MADQGTAHASSSSFSSEEWVERAAARFATLRRLPERGSGQEIPGELPAGVRPHGEEGWMLEEGVGGEAPLGIGSRVYFHHRIPSTNARLREIAPGVPSGTLMLAEEQTAGRGRHGRSWYSPPGGGVYVSLLLRPCVPPEYLGWVTLSAALGLVRMARRLGAGAGIKWPNDVLCEGKKTAGILAEVSPAGADIPEVIVGMGVNVSWNEEDVPEEIRGRATALSLCAGRPLDRDRMLAGSLAETGRILEGIEQEMAVSPGVMPAAGSEVQDRMVHLGERVRVRGAGEEMEGTCTGLTPQGYLQLDGGRRVVAGELILHREAEDH